MFGPQTAVVDGQRNTFPTQAQWYPDSYGQQTTGVPNVSPTTPPFFGGSSASMGSGQVNVNGYGTADNNAYVTQMAADHPHNLKVSPVWWAVGSLVVGLVLLRAVHWRRTIIEGNEGARIGSASERAEAEA